LGRLLRGAFAHAITPSSPFQSASGSDSSLSPLPLRREENPFHFLQELEIYSVIGNVHSIPSAAALVGCSYKDASTAYCPRTRQHAVAFGLFDSQAQAFPARLGELHAQLNLNFY